MSKVSIPFLPRFKESMLNGTKTMTSRRKRYGNVGDTFDAFGASFQIVEVGRLTLGDIASFWKEEGMESLEDFTRTWTQIHPHNYNMGERFYYFRFKKAEKPSLRERQESIDKGSTVLREELAGFLKEE